MTARGHGILRENRLRQECVDSTGEARARSELEEVVQQVHWHGSHGVAYRGRSQVGSQAEQYCVHDARRRGHEHVDE